MTQNVGSAAANREVMVFICSRHADGNNSKDSLKVWKSQGCTWMRYRNMAFKTNGRRFIDLSQKHIIKQLPSKQVKHGLTNNN